MDSIEPGNRFPRFGKRLWLQPHQVANFAKAVSNPKPTLQANASTFTELTAVRRVVQTEPSRDCRRLHLLSKWRHHEQDNEHVFI